MKDELFKALVKHLDLKGLAKEVIGEVAEKALKKVVEDSENTIDNAIFPLLWPLFEKEAFDFIDEKLDLGDILGLPSEEDESEPA